MQKIKNIILSYWYPKMDYNPKDKVMELQKELDSVFDNPLMYNEEDATKLYSMPRIQVLTNDKKKLFQMSLINTNVIINVDDIDFDEGILLINNNMQLFYDVLKEVFDLKFIYTSVKVEIMEEISNSASFLAKKFNLDNDYEDFSIKRGFIKDNYYINYILNSGREYNFNIDNPNGMMEQDIMDKTMTLSLSDAKLNKEFIMSIVEINDRYAYNVDASHETSKEDIRGMVIELKKILNEELYNK